MTDEVKTAVPAPTTPTLVAVAAPLPHFESPSGRVTFADQASADAFKVSFGSGLFEDVSEVKVALAEDFAKAHALVVKFGLGIGGLVAGWILAKIF